MKRSLRSALVAIAVLATIAVAAPAHAATGTWGAPADLSAVGVNAFGAQVAVAGDGTIIVTWYGDNGSGSVVQTARSTDGGVTWGTPVTLSGTNTSYPQIAVGGDGTFTVTWTRNQIVQAAVSTDSGVTWSGSIDLSAAGGNPNNPQVFAGDDGTIAVTWEMRVGFNWVVQASTSPNAGVTWSAPTDVSAVGNVAEGTEVTVADDGTIFVAWTFDGGSGRTVQASTSTDAGATWSAPSDLSAAGNAFNPRLATSPDGTVTVTWQQYGGTSSLVRTSRSTDGGATWSPPVDLSVDGVDAYNARIAVAGNGTIAVSWERGNGGIERIVQAATSTNGGLTWSATVNLSAAGDYSDNPELVVGADGTFTATWERGNAGPSIVEVATLTGAGAAWGAPIGLSSATGRALEPQLAVGNDGAVTVAWQVDDGFGGNSIQASTLAVAAAAAPGLASGGSNAAPIGLTGAVLLALGCVLVARRRHATAS